MTAAAETVVPELCAVCGEDLPPLGTVPFRRGKPRRVCVMCLARAIQDATGWKMVRMVEQNMRATLAGPEISARYRGTFAAARAALEPSGE